MHRLQLNQNIYFQMIIQLGLVCAFRIHMLALFHYLLLDGSLKNVNSSSTNFIGCLYQDYLLIDFLSRVSFFFNPFPALAAKKWPKIKIPKYKHVTTQIKILQHLLVSPKEGEKCLNLLAWYSYPIQMRSPSSFQMFPWITSSPENIVYFMPFKQSTSVLMWQNLISLKCGKREKSMWHTSF